MVTGKPGRSDFDGYEKLSLADADRIVRQLLEDRLDDLSRKVRACSEKARASGREKLLSEIEAISKRLSRIKEMTTFKEGTYVPPFLKERILKADTESLNETDDRLLGLLDEAFSLITELSCSEKDLYIVTKLSAMSTALRNFETELSVRSRLLKQELTH
mgnify:CR=1 FL=1